MTYTFTLRLGLVLLMFAVMPVEAWAGDLAGVYTVSHGGEGARNMTGGVASFAGYPLPWFGLVIEGGGQRNGGLCSYNYARGKVWCDGAHAILTVAAGPRVMFRRGHAAAPFVQVLRGGATGNNYGDFGLGAVNAVVWQPGIGVDLRKRRNVAVRVAGDYFRPDGGERHARMRFSVGVVFSRPR
jgi:hypothetical protein